MQIDTPQIAKHLLRDPRNYFTPVGGFLRRASLDELPQLVTIFRGDMTFVGPRPALFNQDDLVNLRTEYGVNVLVPGLTGWAQVNGRDELPIPEKVQLDREYLLRRSLLLDIAIIGRTVFKALVRQGVHH
jgi:O-antigen biosynthesis protein WbqP